MIKKISTFLLVFTLLFVVIPEVKAEFYLGPVKIGTGPVAVLSATELSGFTVTSWKVGQAFYTAQQVAQKGYETVVLLAPNNSNSQAAHYGGGRLWPIKHRGIIKKTPFRIVLIGQEDYVFGESITKWTFNPNDATVIPISATMTKQEFATKVRLSEHKSTH